MALTVVVQTPGVSQFFGCTPLGPVGWAIAGTSASLATAASVVDSYLTNDGENDNEEEVHVSQVETQQTEQTEQTEKQVEEVKESSRQLGRTARLVLSETAYATLGVGGVAVDLVRRTPAALRTLNHQAATGVKVVGSQMCRGLVGLARRGHTMVGSAPLQTRQPESADDVAKEHAAREEPDF
ncbi:MAG: hypothetical protein ACRDYA_06975 [Egibacteraceae bacterium]